MRIVVVEDGAKIRRGIINLIQKINPQYRIVGEAANGVDGLQVIAGEKPDLVIADIRMPELNGLEMLQGLKERGIKHKTIILSAYSDFSFAQQAITLGVSEYLLKPVTAEKLQKSLLTIEQELKIERQKDQSSRLLTVKHMLQDVLTGKSADLKKLEQNLTRELGFQDAQPFVMVGAYTGNKIYDQEALHQVLNQLLAEVSADYQYLVMDIEISGLTLFLTTCQSGPAQVESFLEETLDKVHQYDFPNLVMGWVQIDSVEQIFSKLQQLSEMLKWAIILGKNNMITQSGISRLATKPPNYPNELEKQAIAAASRKDTDMLRTIIQEFVAWWQKEIYPPEQIIAGFVRLISSIINAVKETDAELFKLIKQHEILQMTLNAITMDQLEGVLKELLNRFTPTERRNLAHYSLTVIKALKLLTENYHQGITREEIATRLHITPEYLSMLFYREVGQSFTTYLKNYRINKAKELLAHDNLKIYEVAEKVGYPDSKYFCRVFKEVTGIPPGEFQKYLFENRG